MTEMLRLFVSDFAQYVRLEQCQRYLRFRLFPQEPKQLARSHATPSFQLREQALSPLLHAAGSRFEREFTALLQSRRARVHGPLECPESEQWEATQRWVTALDDEPQYLLQGRLEGTFDGIHCLGHPDLLRGVRRKDGQLELLVVDLKASRKDRVEHRIQVATYLLLLETWARSRGLPLLLKGRVLRRHPDRDFDDLEGVLTGTESFDPTAYLHAARVFLCAKDSPLREVARARSCEAIFYALGYKCDGCLFNSHCMVDTCARKDLSAIPTLRPSEKKKLHRHGLRSFVALGQLKALPSTGQRLTPTPGHEELLSRLEREAGLGSRLDALIQRSRHLDRSYAFKEGRKAPRSRSFLYNSGFSRLPDPSTHEPLVQVFLDAQHDYLEDRLYLLSARIQRGEEICHRIHISPRPPGSEEEGLLLKAWLQEIAGDIREFLPHGEGYLHVYLYDSYDQTLLLDGLQRHLASLGSQGAPLYGLLSQPASLEHEWVSFLADELKRRKNVPLTCLSLQQVATKLGFPWPEPLKRQFYHGIFDSHPKQSARGWVLENASRHSSQLPLEYAYAAWSHEAAIRLPEGLEGSRFTHATVDGQRRPTTWTLLGELAKSRLDAMAFLEKQCVPRESKRPPTKSPLTREAWALESNAEGSVWETFLRVEHAARLHHHFAEYAQPPEARMREGRALILEHDVQLESGWNALHRFHLRPDAIGWEAEEVAQRLRLCEGDWVVLSPYQEATLPWRVKTGWLGRIEEIEAESLVLKSMSLLSKGQADTAFKWRHSRRPFKPQQLYVAAPAADDAQADRLLRACVGVEQHPLLQLLESQKEADSSQQGHWESFLGEVLQLWPDAPPTRAQARIIAHPAPLVLLQGPPGTGKSHTLGYFVVCRLFAAAMAGETMRVFLCAKTHNAVHIALQHVHHKWQRLAEGSPLCHALEAFRRCWIGKASTQRQLADLPSLHPDRKNRKLYRQPLLVIGGTPSASYKIQRAVGERYPEGFFDLIAIDEASQMSIHEGLLGSWMLKSGGSILLAGDHRQLPPITSHPWERREAHQSPAHAVSRSLFAYARDHSPPEAHGILDLSFRLPASHARFLDEHVYRDDFERRPGLRSAGARGRFLLDPDADPLLAKIFAAPCRTLLMIHDEEDSHQKNPLEAALLGRILKACKASLAQEYQKGVDIGVIVPHRLQRSALRKAHPEFADDIDTVDRFQGGERRMIAIAATASQPDAIREEVDFLLHPSRFNVAISRQSELLVVIASRHIFRFLTSDVEMFERAALWKSLREEASLHLHSLDIGDHVVEIWGIPEEERVQ